MYHEDKQQTKGEGGMVEDNSLLQQMVDMMLIQIRIIQIQATIHISMINECVVSREGRVGNIEEFGVLRCVYGAWKVLWLCHWKYLC